MGKKQVDINLFKAASKADKKIQTGVSKSFIIVIAGVVIVVAIAFYIGMLYMGNATLQEEVDVYDGKDIYLTNINVLSNRIEQDQAMFNSIQSQINAANSIKYYSYGTSVLYPGVTTDQRIALITRDTATPNPGLLPDDVIIDEALGIGIELSYTDGYTAYEVLEYSETDSSYSKVSKIFENGYLIIKFEAVEESVADQYVANLVASNIFAIEEGITNRHVLTAASFEVGFVDRPDMGNGATNPQMYIKCKLKPIFQIIDEDSDLQYYISSITEMDYTANSLTMTLQTQHNKSIHSICSDFYALGLFTDIDFSSESWTEGGYCDGTIILHLSEEVTE